jgi:hypothetical protein
VPKYSVSTGSPETLSGLHDTSAGGTVVSGLNVGLIVVVACVPLTTGHSVTGFTRTLTFGPSGSAVALTSLGAIDVENSGSPNGWVEMFALIGPPIGDFDLNFSAGAAVDSIIMESISYTGVSQVTPGSFTSNALAGTTCGVAVASAPGKYVVAGFACSAAITGVTGGNERLLDNVGTSGNAQNLLLADGAGAAVVSLTATTALTGSSTASFAAVACSIDAMTAAMADHQALTDSLATSFSGTPTAGANPDLVQIAASGALGALLALTGAPAAGATPAQLQAAAQAVASAQAALGQQTAAINSQLPTFYGVAAANTLNAQMSLSGSTLPSTFTNKGPLTATLDGATVAGAVFAALFDGVADTDQETVSDIWSTPITFNGGARYLFLRVNSTFTTYLYVKWFATSTTITIGGSTNTLDVFNVELGCVVAGVKTVFSTFSSETEDLAASTFIAASSNTSISLEATADAIQFNYPSISTGNPASIAFTDSSGVSQIGSGFRQAGFGSDESPVVLPSSFAFADSGPSSGAGGSPIVTPASVAGPPTGAQTTTSTTFAKLPTTTDQVTVNIGPKGIALVFLSSNATNSGAGQANFVGFAMSGANTAAASFNEALDYQAFAASNTASGGFGNMFPKTGLTPGATTFEMEYAVSGGTGTFWNRSIFVLPL